MISCWACSVGLSFVFVLCGLDLYGIWLAFAIDELFRGTLYYVRWRKKSWQKNYLKGGI
jgi:Na+-driven multidrug efflux pump